MVAEEVEENKTIHAIQVPILVSLLFWHYKLQKSEEIFAKRGAFALYASLNILQDASYRVLVVR